jgi:hypothetical protein
MASGNRRNFRPLRECASKIERLAKHTCSSHCEIDFLRRSLHTRSKSMFRVRDMNSYFRMYGLA